MPLVPDYAPVTGPRIARGLYGWVLFCAIAPMVTGVGIFLLFVITRDQRLPIAGFFFLMIGSVLVVIGFGLLLWYRSQQRRANLLAPATLRKRTIVASLLLAANFLVGFGCAVLGARETGREIFVVTNTGTKTLHDVRVVLPDGTQLHFGDLVPQQSKRRSAFCGFEGDARIVATVDGQVVSTPLGIYMDGSFGARRIVTFDGKTATVK